MSKMIVVDNTPTKVVKFTGAIKPMGSTDGDFKIVDDRSLYEEVKYRNVRHSGSGNTLYYFIIAVVGGFILGVLSMVDFNKEVDSMHNVYNAKKINSNGVCQVLAMKKIVVAIYQTGDISNINFFSKRMDYDILNSKYEITTFKSNKENKGITQSKPKKFKNMDDAIKYYNDLE